MAARTAASEPDPQPGVEREFEEGVEHLQAAAHEMLAAARSFLDVVEDVVSDREKLHTVANSLTDLFAGAGSSLAKMADRVAGSTGERNRDAGTSKPRIRRIDID